MNGDVNEMPAQLERFFMAIANDPRVSVTHVGLFAALLHCWATKGYVNPLQVYSYEVMGVAKLSGANTYHRILKALAAYGYIKYEPSFNKKQASRIYLVW